MRDKLIDCKQQDKGEIAELGMSHCTPRICWSKGFECFRWTQKRKPVWGCPETGYSIWRACETFVFGGKDVWIKYMNSSKQSKWAALFNKSLQIKYWVVWTMMRVMREHIDEVRGTTTSVAKFNGYFSILPYLNLNWPSTQLTTSFFSWLWWSILFLLVLHCLLFLSLLYGTSFLSLKFECRNVPRIWSCLLFHLYLLFILRS